MAGTKIGGQKAAAKNLENDPDFYKKNAYRAQLAWDMNGRKPRGFAYDPELARIAGAKGGRRSKRKKQDVQEEA
jgi:general stress protein YciG